ncbi:hypothetical protein Bbelb_195980 [Branchiostoma belcheri]|nr:hypothetical protein Bbelb_195980 [Branchiostoma belcheri]
MSDDIFAQNQMTESLRARSTRRNRPQLGDSLVLSGTKSSLRGNYSPIDFFLSLSPRDPSDDFIQVVKFNPQEARLHKCNNSNYRHCSTNDMSQTGGFLI